MATTTYAHPEMLVSTDWVAQHLDDKSVRLIEVDVDTTRYEQGHIRGAIGWNWQTQLQDPVQAGVSVDSLIVLYGDNNNWFAAYALWLLQYYGHNNVRLVNGGRKKWILEGRELTREVTVYSPTKYQALKLQPTLRASRDFVFKILEKKNVALVDVRSVDEYTGKIIAPPGMTGTAQRAGHIPGAKNIPWSQAVNDDGTFKSFSDLKALYEGKGITSDKDEVVAYCRIGKRSSHSWFVLKYLLGYPTVRNYDGSWTEWGNLINAPIEKDV